MFSKKTLFPAALVFVGATAIVAAQNDVVLKSTGTTVWGRHAKMTLVTEPAPSFTTTNINDPGLITIFNNLAAKYPKGEYWCCEGYNVMGPNSGAGEQWMAAAFTPGADHTVTRIAVAVGYSQQGTNGVVLSLNDDNNGAPGAVLKSWNVSGLPRFGTCCTLAVKSDSSGIPVNGGKQYWVVLSTDGSELDTVDGWNVDDADQVDPATVASYTSNKWTVFQAIPGVAFAVQGSN
jgi:hypothetical protein